MKKSFRDDVEKGCRFVEEAVERAVSDDKTEIVPVMQDVLLQDSSSEDVMQPIELNDNSENESESCSFFSIPSSKTINTEEKDGLPNDAVAFGETSSPSDAVPRYPADAAPAQSVIPSQATTDAKWVKELKEIVALQNEIISIQKTAPTDVSNLCEHIVARLECILERSGAEIIEGDQIFNILRHQPVPMALVKDGTPIEKTLTPGWAVGELVLRRAAVTIGK